MVDYGVVSASETHSVRNIVNTRKATVTGADSHITDNDIAASACAESPVNEGYTVSGSSLTRNIKVSAVSRNGKLALERNNAADIENDSSWPFYAFNAISE